MEDSPMQSEVAPLKIPRKDSYRGFMLYMMHRTTDPIKAVHGASLLRAAVEIVFTPVVDSLGYGQIEKEEFEDQVKGLDIARWYASASADDQALIWSAASMARKNTRKRFRRDIKDCKKVSK